MSLRASDTRHILRRTSVFGDLSDLRESLLAARLLREEIVAFPAEPRAAARLRDRFRRDNGGGAALTVALRLARAARTPAVDRAALVEIATAAGGAGQRGHA